MQSSEMLFDQLVWLYFPENPPANHLYNINQLSWVKAAIQKGYLR